MNSACKHEEAQRHACPAHGTECELFICPTCGEKLYEEDLVTLWQ
jgi:hypothetical protein